MVVQLQTPSKQRDLLSAAHILHQQTTHFSTASSPAAKDSHTMTNTMAPHPPEHQGPPSTPQHRKCCVHCLEGSKLVRRKTHDRTKSRNNMSVLRCVYE